MKLPWPFGRGSRSKAAIPAPASAVFPTEVLDGGEVALQVLQAIGYRTVLKTATIVSYNMQDYDFWGQGVLSHLLLRQLAFGASIQLMTTPPPGRPARAAFREKYALLSVLDRRGVAITLNAKLHAKAYLFLDSRDIATAIIGSANLTGPGFGMVLSPRDSLVEMATYSGDPSLLNLALDFVRMSVVGDSRSESYATWFARNALDIGKAGL